MAKINGKPYKHSDVKIMIGGQEIECTTIQYNTDEDQSDIETPKSKPVKWSGTIDVDKAMVEAMRATIPAMKPLEFTSNEMIELLSELGLGHESHKIIPDMIYTVTS